MELQRVELHREKPVPTRCVCRLRISEYAHNECSDWTSGPDEPLCQFCEAARHHEDANFDPIIKGVSHVS